MMSSSYTLCIGTQEPPHPEKCGFFNDSLQDESWESAHLDTDGLLLGIVESLFCSWDVRAHRVAWRQRIANPIPSDQTDDEWSFVAPYLTVMTVNAPQRHHDV
jgi:hypothetical protein